METARSKWSEEVTEIHHQLHVIFKCFLGKGDLHALIKTLKCGCDPESLN